MFLDNTNIAADATAYVADGPNVQYDAQAGHTTTLALVSLFKFEFMARTQDWPNRSPQLARRTETAQGLAFRQLGMLFDCLPRVSIDGLVALERRIRSQRIDDGRARERETDGRRLEDADGDVAGRAIGELGDDGEEEEGDNTAGDAAPRHFALADFGHGPPDVSTLEERADDPNESDEHTVLLVTPVEHWYLNAFST